ncbi:lasso peptide biosynthesis PqqD family chaperone [Plantactinospora sonchi]|uniref:Lasso peptide biosynthesis PqqD family chaperone n=1 Tax=Plantactinospora sonchi TaxID=1544735 RepID=A0ABU7S411_9ACTN
MSFSLAAYVTATETEHGVVLLDERTGRYWQMNDTAAVVLRCLLDGGSVESAVSTLRGRFPDAADQIIQDVTDLVDALRAAKVMS